MQGSGASAHELGLGFRAQGVGLRAWGEGRGWGSGSRVEVSGFGAKGVGIRVQGVGMGAQPLWGCIHGGRVSSSKNPLLGFRAWSLGSCVPEKEIKDRVVRVCVCEGESERERHK